MYRDALNTTARVNNGRNIEIAICFLSMHDLHTQLNTDQNTGQSSFKFRFFFFRFLDRESF